MGATPDWATCFYFAGVLQRMGSTCTVLFEPCILFFFTFFVYLLFTLCCLLFVVCLILISSPPTTQARLLYLLFYSLLFCFVLFCFLLPPTTTHACRPSGSRVLCSRELSDNRLRRYCLRIKCRKALYVPSLHHCHRSQRACYLR